MIVSPARCDREPVQRFEAEPRLPRRHSEHQLWRPDLATCTPLVRAHGLAVRELVPFTDQRVECSGRAAPEALTARAANTGSAGLQNGGSLVRMAASHHVRRPGPPRHHLVIAPLDARRAGLRCSDEWPRCRGHCAHLVQL
eukprot:scaffold129710_cov90-Phaeocystis_antarctica.AAC.1